MMNNNISGTSVNSENIDKPAAKPVILPVNGLIPATQAPKKSWAHCLPLCPTCGEPMSREGKGWKCPVFEKPGKPIRGCGGTDTNGKWRVEYFPLIPTLNQKQKERLNKLTLETWPNEDTAGTRVTALEVHFGGGVLVPKQDTWLPAGACRVAERIVSKHTLAVLEPAEKLLDMLKSSPLKSLKNLEDFVVAHEECEIKCTPKGMVKYCKDTKWSGDLVSKPTFVEAVQKVLKHKIGGMGGGKPISKSQITKSISQNGYIMAQFQPNYPEPTYPEVLTEKAIYDFVTYSYDTPREGMPQTEMEKWRQACAVAEREGLPLPSQPVEQQVYKLVPDGADQHGVVKWKKVPGTLKYPRPWPRTVANSMLIACRALLNAFARATLCREPAGWISAATKDLRTIRATDEVIIAEAITRAKERRMLTAPEEQRILNASLEVDGGIGAPSVLWQSWGGGRRADVVRYCQENLKMVGGKIQTSRYQTKNGSSKDVTAMLNFYIMADYLIRRDLWTDENFKHGLSPLVRMRILARAGFWEESWKVLSVADSRAGEDFGYQPFETDDLINLPLLVDCLRGQSSPASALFWHGLSESDREALSKYLPSDKLKLEICNLIVRRLNEIMYGPNLREVMALHGVTLRARTSDLLARNPTGPNREYLQRLLLEDMFPKLLATRQGCPPNALRRTGMSAYFQVFESDEKTVAYFSTGFSSWKKEYETACDKSRARDHWQVLYSCMASLYSKEDRNQFLPDGHKLQDFRTPLVIEAEIKNQLLADEHNLAAVPADPRKKSSGKRKNTYTPEEKEKWVALFVTEAAATGITQKPFAAKHNLVFGVFHRWLDLAGHTQKTRAKPEIATLITEFKASGQKQAEFAESKSIPFRTFWTYLEEAGETEKCDKHTPEEMASIVEQYKVSKLNKADFADSVGIHVTTLRKWLVDADIAKGRRKVDHQTEIDQFVQEHQKTGISRAAFAETIGVPSETFCGWLRKADVLTEESLTPEQIAAHVAQFPLSGMTQEQYAQSIGVCKKTLYGWLKLAGMTTSQETKEQIAAYCQQFEASGMNQTDFARSIGKDYSTVNLWLKKAGLTKKCRDQEKINCDA